MTKLELSLKAKTREIKGKKVNQLRKQGKIPAVLYGHEIESVNLIVDYSVFEKIFGQAGESTLVDLSIDDKKPVKVLIQDCQIEPTTNQFIHVDFHQVRMDEKLHTKIILKFIGEAPAVKEFGGILVTNIDALEVECLPQDLVHEIEVDLSGLKTFTDVIHVSDIKLPPKITILNVPTNLVVLVQPPRTEKELADLEDKPKEELPVEAIEEKESEEKAEKPKKEQKQESKK